MLLGQAIAIASDHFHLLWSLAMCNENLKCVGERCLIGRESVGERLLQFCDVQQKKKPYPKPHKLCASYPGSNYFYFYDMQQKSLHKAWHTVACKIIFVPFRLEGIVSTDHLIHFWRRAPLSSRGGCFPTFFAARDPLKGLSFVRNSCSNVTSKARATLSKKNRHPLISIKIIPEYAEWADFNDSHSTRSQILALAARMCRFNRRRNLLAIHLT